MRLLTNCAGTDRRSYERATLRALVILALAGCNGDERRAQPAATMSAPPTRIAVGPIPGPEGEPATVRNPFGEDPAALRDGRRLFVAFNCSGCHGGRAGGGMGPSLRDEQWLYGQTDAHIFDSIATGRANGMPAWGVRLPESEIWKMVAYIQSLRTAREPDAPN
jgi:cytochrome c oxidase cbb3-type subunit 3